MTQSMLLDSWGQPIQRDEPQMQASPYDDFWYSQGVGVSSSVNEKTAMTIPAAFACVKCIAEDSAKVPLKVYFREDERRKRDAVEHPLYRLLMVQPNPEMSSMNFREAVTKDLARAGNGYAEIVFKGDTKFGRVPFALWPLDCMRVRPKRTDSGALYYEHTNDAGDIVRIPADRMLHLRGMGDGISGWSPVQLMKLALGVALAQNEYSESSMQNDSTPGGVLEHPGRLSTEAAARLTTEFERKHGGPRNRRKLAVLMEGMKYNPLSPPPDDMQFLERMQFSEEEVARIWRVPPHKIQHLLHATFSNIEHQGIEYVVDCLTSYFVRWEQEIAIKLLSGPQNDGYYVKHIDNALMRGDAAARSAFYSAMFQVGSMGPNDIREKEDMNPIDGGDGYFLNGTYTPLNLIDKLAESRIEPKNPPKTDNSEVPEPENRSERIVSAHEPVFAAELRRIYRTHKDKSIRASKRDDFGQWAQEFYSHEREYVISSLMPASTALAACFEPKTGESADISPLVGEIADYVVTRSVRELKSIELVESWTETRPEEDAAYACRHLASAFGIGPEQGK